MSTTFRIYRDNETTAVTEFVGSDGVAVDVSVPTTGWTPGTYTIKATRQYAGLAESAKTAWGTPLVVNAAGISDDFNRADGALGSNWQAIPPDFTLAVISGQKAVPAGLTTQTGARWAGASTVGANQTVIARLGPGIATGDGCSLVARWLDPSNLIEANRKEGGTNWILKAVIAGVNTSQIGSSNTDEWCKIVCSGTTVTFSTAPDSAGAPGTWTQRHQITNAGLTFTGQPGFFFWGGFNTTGTASTHYVDTFSAV